MSDWIEAAPGAFYNLEQIEVLRKVGGDLRIAFVSGGIGSVPEDCIEALLRAVEERARLVVGKERLREALCRHRRGRPPKAEAPAEG